VAQPRATERQNASAKWPSDQKTGYPAALFRDFSIDDKSSATEFVE
jgi:hypothetical protein